MMPFQKLLFPCDFSAAAETMVPDITALAQKFNATLVVLHAFNVVHGYNLAPSVDAPFAPEQDSIPYVPALRELRHIHERRLQEFASAHFSGIRTKMMIEDGDPATVIEWAAENEHADLITMPTRGLGRFRRMLLGSLTAKVLHDVDCAVYTSAHEPANRALPSGAFKSILCAVRMDPDSEVVMKTAASFSEAFGARICLLHLHSPGSSKDQEPTPQEIQQVFQRVVGPERLRNLVTRVCILDALVPEGIRDKALEERADLVVAGRGHARSSVSSVWSHLYTVIRESPCPVYDSLHSCQLKSAHGLPRWSGGC
jgi:nucleotide-binding universal stress UspA family protein